MELEDLNAASQAVIDYLIGDGFSFPAALGSAFTRGRIEAESGVEWEVTAMGPTETPGPGWFPFAAAGGDTADVVFWRRPVPTATAPSDDAAPGKD